MDEFINRLINLKNLKLKKSGLSDILSKIRLVVFITGVVLSILCFKKGYSFYGFLAILVFLVAYLVIVVKHNSVKELLERINCKIIINQNYLDRNNEEWIHFKDSGNDFVDDEHPYTSDLDIFGLKSIFQWMNVSYTFKGREILSDILKSPEKDIEVIKSRQEAVKELSKKIDFTQELQCEGMLAKEIHNNPKELIEYAENPSELFERKWVEILFYLLPFITISVTVLYCFKYPVPAFVPFTMFLIQIIFTGIGSLKVAPVLSNVHKFKTSIEAYKNIIKMIEKENFEAEYLRTLQNELIVNNKKASVKIKSLERIVEAIDLRYNAIPYIILNIVVLWDYHCLFALEEWKRTNGRLINKWFHSVGCMEAISSLGVTIQTNPNWRFPGFTKKAMKLNAKNLGHPLISQNKRVNNNLEMENNICIITGSNMSGKTTLLRTLGMNLVLAYSGAPVCADKLECSIMEIFTSMRVSDDLNSGISTFYAELLRIKKIVEYSKEKLPMIFLIDELFRGTNSRDRIIGAKSLLINLDKPWIIGMISTHDFELCDLSNERDGRVVNYHFTESYENNRIKFDYKLRDGRSSTTNAKFLMRMVGIELVE
jgi:DNA mismatch repair ATPase MutS